MKRKLLLYILLLVSSSYSLMAQSSGSEENMKKNGNDLFAAGNFSEAKPIYAQLLSLYPKDPDYNYKYGTCVLLTESDKEKPIKYLQFAVSKGGVEPQAYFYLAKAHHLNYDFAKAVKFYSRFKTKAKQEDRDKFQVDRQIEMCKNGNNLLSKLNEVQVLERQEIAAKDFYRIYDTESVSGKLIVKPEDFQTKYDKKVGEKSIIFLPNDAKEAYFSSYGKKGENGRDIYKSIKLGNGEWSEPVNIGPSINTKYDEDYAFIHPDGRTLYFASKGHTSMGGYDIFRSLFDDETGQWGTPENMDFAFSSADDDIMFVTDRNGVLAYFASNRANEYGQFTVYKVLIDKKAPELSVISGKFIAESNPDNKSAKITVIEKTSNETIGIYQTDANGFYTIEITQNGGDFQFNVETTDDAPIHTGVVSIPSQDLFTLLGQELRLVGEGDDQQLVIKNIFDGTAVSNTPTAGPVVSSEVLRMKANLDVNYDQSNLEQLAADNAIDYSSNNQEEVLDDEDNEEEVNTTAQSDPENDYEEVDTEIADNPTLEEVEDDPVNESISSPVTSDVLNDRLNELKSSANQNLEEKQQVISSQYAKSLELQQKADEQFTEANNLESSGAAEVDIQIKKKQAGITALEAAYATQIAQKLEESMSDDLAYLDNLENAEPGMQERIGAGSLIEVEGELRSLEEEQSVVKSAAEILASEIEIVDENDRIASKQISDYDSKQQAFATERADLDDLLSDLNAEYENASRSKKEDIQKNIDALQLDINDIEYQKGVLEDDWKKAQFAKKSLKVEKNQLLAANNRLESEDQSASITEDQKNELINKLKEYRDNDVLAYSETNELYANEIQNAPASELASEAGSSTVGSIDTSLEAGTTGTDYSDEQLILINTEFENRVSESEAQLDPDLKLASQIGAYSDWINALSDKKQAISDEFDAEIDEDNRSELQKEIDNINGLLAEKRAIKSNLEEELARRAQGLVELEATPISDVSEINDQTIIDDSFTNFNFDQSYEASIPESAAKLTEAKKALYEAGEISKQADFAQQSAYDLPTVAERNEAFARVNSYNKASEEKQLEAAQAFAEFNLEEFRVNRAIIDNANSLGDRYESGAMDLALLLAEEAEVYFANAAQIRSEVQEDDRLTQKEVALQKAYDYEVLALKKQREAMDKLSLAVSEAVNNVLRPGSVSSSTRPSEPFIQTIVDAEVLSILDASDAKARGDALSKEVEQLQDTLVAQQAIIDAMSEGEAKESAKASLEALQEEINQKTNKAAVWYERENQINKGFVGLERTGLPPESQITEVRKAAIVSNQVAIDTVIVDEDRRQVILNSQAFTDFSNNRQELAAQLTEIEGYYEQALNLARENDQLLKDAIVEKNKAKVVSDEAEKDRLIKSAEVIEQRIAANKQTIDSLNNVIRVKNFIVITLEKKDNETLANLSDIEKIEYQVMTKDMIPANLVTNIPEPVAAVDLGTQSSQTLTSEETSGSIDDLSSLSSDDNGIDSERSSDDTAIIDENRVETAPPASLETIDVVPRQIKEAIFITLQEDESAYNESKPIPTKSSLPNGIIYKVQVGAFRNPIPQDLFKGFAPLMSESAGNGITRYTAGLFVSEQNAVSARNGIRQIGYPDAFVVAFLNGERISISQARRERGGSNDNSSSAQPIPEFNNTSSSSNNSPVNRVSGGSGESLSPNFNQPDVEDVINAKTVDGLYFTVQIGVFSAPVKKGVFDYDGINVVELSNGLIRYNAGMFDNADEASNLKNSIQQNITDAFVSAYYNGERISLTEAARLKNE